MIFQTWTLLVHHKLPDSEEQLTEYTSLKRLCAERKIRGSEWETFREFQLSENIPNR
jgi:hypothetical protein